MTMEKIKKAIFLLKDKTDNAKMKLSLSLGYE